MTTIISDKDDVLVQFVESFLGWYNDKHKTTWHRKDMWDHAYHEPLGITRTQLDKEFNAFYKSVAFAEMPLVDGALDGLDRLLCAGINIEIITARPFRVKEQTHAQYKRHFKNHVREIHMVGVEDAHLKKAALAKERGAIAIIEDSARNAGACASQGIAGYLLDAPWNRKCQAPHVRHAKDWVALTTQLLGDLAGYHHEQNGLPRPTRRSGGTEYQPI